MLYIYYLGLSNICSNCIQAGFLRILSYFPRLPRSATALLTFLAPPGFVFQLFGSILRSPVLWNAVLEKKPRSGPLDWSNPVRVQVLRNGEKMDAFLKVGPQKLRLALYRYFKRQWWCVMLCQGSETYIHASLEQSRPSTESGRAKWRQHWPFLSPTNRGENSRGIAGQWQYCCQLPARRQDQKGQKVKSWNQWCSNMTVK